MDRKLTDVDLFNIYTKWSCDLGAFKCFFRSTNFVSLKHYPDFILKAPSQEGGSCYATISNVIINYNHDNTLFILDIEGSEAIRTAFFLRKTFLLSPVLVFNGVLHQFGLVGNVTYINNLLGYGLQLEAIKQKGYVFILDNNRFGDYTEDELKENFNNQYELGEEDLPSAEMIKEIGYSNVVYIYQNEKEDLAAYIDYLIQENIEVEKVKFL